MKSLACLLLLGLTTQSVSFQPLAAPSRMPNLRRDYLMDVALEGHRKFVAAGESSQMLRVGRFYQDYKGDWFVDSLHPDAGDAMDPLFYGIARSAMRYVAVGQHNYRFKDAAREYPVISVSDDGIAWSTRVAPAKGALWGVATDGADQWVAVGSEQILLSADGGEHWGLALDRTGGETHAVARGSQVWMAATTLAQGDGTVFHVSPDGRTWRESSRVLGIRIASLVEGDGIWVAVGTYGPRGERYAILRSADQGANWVEVGGSRPQPQMRDVQWGPKTGFVAVGSDGANGLALWSRDGMSWQLIHASFHGSPRALQIFESPTPEGPEGTSEIVMVGDSGAVWLDTLTFDTRRSVAAVRPSSRPDGAWKQTGNRLEAPVWLAGQVELSLRTLDGRLEKTWSEYVGTSREFVLPRFWGARLLEVRDASWAVHRQTLGSTQPLF
ncbi:MAG TPA: hypothetical protein PKY05_02835 [Fibrobacteria bacterium]|nr:hypothetical protein [Fibrobacteria bacterium]